MDVAIPAPYNEYLGINIKFNIIFNTAPTPANKANICCLFADAKKYPNIVVKNMNTSADDKIFNELKVMTFVEPYTKLSMKLPFQKITNIIGIKHIIE